MFNRLTNKNCSRFSRKWVKFCGNPEFPWFIPSLPISPFHNKNLTKNRFLLEIGCKSRVSIENFPLESWSRDPQDLFESRIFNWKKLIQIFFVKSRHILNFGTINMKLTVIKQFFITYSLCGANKISKFDRDLRTSFLEISNLYLKLILLFLTRNLFKNPF